jgi:hypothetical protein
VNSSANIYPVKREPHETVGKFHLQWRVYAGQDYLEIEVSGEALEIEAQEFYRSTFQSQNNSALFILCNYGFHETNVGFETMIDLLEQTRTSGITKSRICIVSQQQHYDMKMELFNELSSAMKIDARMFTCDTLDAGRKWLQDVIDQSIARDN